MEKLKYEKLVIRETKAEKNEWKNSKELLGKKREEIEGKGKKEKEVELGMKEVKSGEKRGKYWKSRK